MTHAHTYTYEVSYVYLCVCVWAYYTKVLMRYFPLSLFSRPYIVLNMRCWFLWSGKKRKNWQARVCIWIFWCLAFIGVSPKGAAVERSTIVFAYFLLATEFDHSYCPLSRFYLRRVRYCLPYRAAYFSFDAFFAWLVYYFSGLNFESANKVQ